MSYQYIYCPTCGTRRASHGYRCSVCDGLMPRARAQAQPRNAHLRTLVTWAPRQTVEALPHEQERLAA